MSCFCNKTFRIFENYNLVVTYFRFYTQIMRFTCVNVRKGTTCGSHEDISVKLTQCQVAFMMWGRTYCSSKEFPPRKRGTVWNTFKRPFLLPREYLQTSASTSKSRQKSGDFDRTQTLNFIRSPFYRNVGERPSIDISSPFHVISLPHEFNIDLIQNWISSGCTLEGYIYCFSWNWLQYVSSMQNIVSNSFKLPNLYLYRFRVFKTNVRGSFENSDKLFRNKIQNVTNKIKSAIAVQKYRSWLIVHGSIEK